MISVLLKELNSFLDSLIAYIVIGVFLTGLGLTLWIFPETSVLEYGFSSMETLFLTAPYVFMFLIPAITMKMFAEEKKQGTLELLLTKPLTDWQIILGKYFSAVIIVLFSILPTLVYYYSIYVLGSPSGNIDTAGVAGSYIGLFLLGCVFTAIGLLASSLTENQIISFVLAVFISFILYSGLDSFAAIDVWGRFSLIIEQIGLLYHYDSISRGLIDSRDVIYFISMITIMLLLVKSSMEAKKW
jgi:ABC-2 type transport system permease protein